MTVSPQAIPWLNNSDFHSVVTEGVRSRLNEGPVKYDEVKALKHALLRIAFDSFKKDDKNAAEIKRFAEFRKSNERWLIPYALFPLSWIITTAAAFWTQWEEDFRDPRQAIVMDCEKPSQS